MSNTIAKKLKIRWPPHSGVQFKYTYEEVKAKFAEYIEYCVDEGKVPMIGGFAVHCGMTNQTFCNYAKRGQDDEEKKRWRELIDFIRDYIEDWKWSKAYTGEINQRIFHFDMLNHHRKITARTLNDNRNETTGTLKVTGIQRTIIDPAKDKQRAKAELEQAKAEHQGDHEHIPNDDNQAGTRPEDAQVPSDIEKKSLDEE